MTENGQFGTYLFSWPTDRLCTQQNCYCHFYGDETDCPFAEPQQFSLSWFYPKLHSDGLRYYVGVSIGDGKIVWVGPFPCGAFTDLKIYQRELKKKLMEGEVVIADNGYHEPTALKQADAIGEEEHHRNVHARHNYFNGHLKRFNVLNTKFL